MYGKQYYVRVKADCLAEDYSDYITTLFITTCGAVNPIAYSETFDLYPTDNDKPICWTRSASFSTNGRNSYPNASVGTSQDNVGGSLNMHATPNYPMSMIASPEFANSLDNSELTLYARYNISLNSTTDFGEAYLGVMSDPNDSNTFIPLYDLITDVRHQWVKHTISLIGVPATHRHIAFRMRSISGYPDMYIDNINVYQALTCVMPSNVRFVSKGYDTVMVACHNNNNTANFTVEYSRNSDFSESSTLNVTDTTVVIRGLEPDTEYFVRVQADCGNGDESFWTDGKSFYTDCSDFDPQNWTESFASYTRDKNKPDCWTRTALYEGHYDTYPYVSSYYKQDTVGGGLYIMGSANTPMVMIATPKFSGPLNNSEITLYLMKAYNYPSYVGSMTLGTMTDPNDSTTFVGIADITPTEGNVWVKHFISLADAPTDARYLAFKYNLTSGDPYFYLDNISLHTMPTCLVPTNISATALPGAIEISGSSQNGNTELGYELGYRLEGTNIWKSKFSQTLPATIDELQYENRYHLRVRAKCTEQDYSEWYEIPSTVTTDCGTLQLPWHYNFIENDTLQQSGYACLTPLRYDASYPRVSTTQGSLDANSLEMYLASYSSVTDSMTMVLPKFEDSLQDAWLTFYAKNTQGYGRSHLTIGALDDNLDWSSFISIQDIQVTNTWQKYTVLLSDVPDINPYITFTVVKDTKAGSPDYFIDNIVIENVPSCINPTNVRRVRTSDASVTIAWSSNNGETSWEVAYKADVATEWNTTFANDTIHTIAGEEPSTKYNFKVRAICNPGDTSIYTEPIVSASTDCAGISYLNEDFESTNTGEVPECWSRICPNDYAFPKVASPYTYYGVPTKSIQFSSYKPIYLISPRFNRSLNGMALDFKLSRENASSGVIQVGVMSDAHDPSTFMPLADYNNDGRDRVLVPYKLLINTSHIADDSIYRYIAFRYGDVGSVTTSTSYWYWLDDVVVDTMPNCMKPENLGLISYTENSATIKVWPYSNENSFSYVITSDMTKTNPDSVGATPVTVNSTTFTIDGLQPNTSYKIWVRTSCDGAVSEWYQDALTFHTLCNSTITIGYTENFDSITIGSIPECWVRLNVYGDNRPGVVEADAYDGIPTPAVKFEGAKSQILVMEKLNVPLNTLQLRFNLVKEGIGCGKFQVGVMSNPTDTSTFVPVATLDNGTMYNQIYCMKLTLLELSTIPTIAT